jgi:hypothetical protein
MNTHRRRRLRHRRGQLTLSQSKIALTQLISLILCGNRCISVKRTSFTQTKTQSIREFMYYTRIYTAIHTHIEEPWRKRSAMEGRSVLVLGVELGLRLV